MPITITINYFINFSPINNKMKKLFFISAIAILGLTAMTVSGQQYFPNYTLGIPVNDTLLTYSHNSNNCAPDYETSFSIMLDTAVSGLKFFVLIDSSNNTVTIPPYGIVQQGDTLPIHDIASFYNLYISYPGFIRLMVRVTGTPQIANESYKCGMLIGVNGASVCDDYDSFNYQQWCTVNNATSVANISSINKFFIFPNPFSSQTVLHTANLLKNATITIDNCFGQTVKQIKNISGQTIILYSDNLPSGLYFIILTQDNTTLKKDKLVIIND
jgi:hypothetical protein